jgi:hypothetical protein
MSDPTSAIRSRRPPASFGMCSAAWLFARTLGDDGGPAMVAEARDQLGRDFPVFDAVCARYLAGEREPRVDPTPVRAALAGVDRVLVIGVETTFLDAAVAALDCEIGLLTYGELEVDWPRVLANYGGRVAPCELPAFQRYAGSRGALLTFLYGAQAAVAHVDPAWLRVVAGDVRTQFRELIGWEVLGGEMYVYPRWLVQAPLVDFSWVIR